MNTNLLFEFTVDKPNKTVYIKREFNATQDLVWDAFTKAELLDQWTAPTPFIARTKHMNFEVGGKRFYAMVGPMVQKCGRCKRILLLPLKPTLKCSSHLPIKMRIHNQQVLIGITTLAKQTEKH